MRRVWIALALVALPRPASAYCRSTTNLDFAPTESAPCDTAGKPLYWAGRCVDMYVASSASQQVDLATARSLVGTALSTWASAKCNACGEAGNPSLIVNEAGATSCPFGYSSGGSNVNLVVFRDSGWTHEPGTLALTTVSFQRETGEIVDADMEIDSDPTHFKLSVGTPDNESYDLASILTHEAGHVMGLDHSDDPGATMYFSYDPGETSMRALTKDDVCGICAVAPPSREAACLPSSAPACDTAGESPAATPEPCPSVTATDSGCTHGRSSSAGALAALAALVALARVRR